jgi:putative tricarboxylic transport membrane protein
MAMMCKAVHAATPVHLDGVENVNNSELWSGIVCFALGVFVVWSGYDLGLGVITDPGSGYVLFYAGILMLIFATTMLYSAVTVGGPKFATLWEGALWTKPLLIIVLLLIFTVAFERVGFLISTMLLLLTTLRVIDPVRWTLAVPLAVLVPLASWYVLQKLLLIQLPSGMFGIG